MSQIKVQDFALEIKKCLKECEEAIKQVLETYKKTKSDVISMTPSEEKAFLNEAFIFLYREADNKWDAKDELTPQFIDGVIESVVIPQGLEFLFKKS